MLTYPRLVERSFVHVNMHPPSLRCLVVAVLCKPVTTDNSPSSVLHPWHVRNTEFLAGQAPHAGKKYLSCVHADMLSGCKKARSPDMRPPHCLLV